MRDRERKCVSVRKRERERERERERVWHFLISFHSIAKYNRRDYDIAHSKITRSPC